MTFDCLVVDDEKLLLDSTSEYLNLFGVKTITAETAKECMDILNKYTIRLILLDINLNKDSGFELCKKIREIIEKIYYDDESARSVAKKNNISHPALIKKRNKILEKLKRLLKDFR